MPVRSFKPVRGLVVCLDALCRGCLAMLITLVWLTKMSLPVVATGFGLLCERT